jgi:hypothetical protein
MFLFNMVLNSLNWIILIMFLFNMVLNSFNMFIIYFLESLQIYKKISLISEF